MADNSEQDRLNQLMAQVGVDPRDTKAVLAALDEMIARDPNFLVNNGLSGSTYFDLQASLKPTRPGYGIPGSLTNQDINIDNSGGGSTEPRSLNTTPFRYGGTDPGGLVSQLSGVNTPAPPVTPNTPFVPGASNPYGVNSPLYHPSTIPGTPSVDPNLMAAILNSKDMGNSVAKLPGVHDILNSAQQVSNLSQTYNDQLGTQGIQDQQNRGGPSSSFKPSGPSTSVLSGIPGLQGLYDFVSGLASGGVQQGNSVYTIPPVSLPTAPNYNFKLNDFSGQANDAAAKAFAPQYQAIDLGKQNAQTEYGNSDTIVAGLYDKLTRENTDRTNAANAQYDTSIANQKQAGTDLSAQIGGNYSAAAAQEAALLGKLGQQGTAQDIIGKNQAEQVFNQNQAVTSNQGQVDKMAADKLSTGQYNRNVASAGQAQGAANRSDLVNQLNGVLKQYDAQKLDVGSNQSQAALSLAQDLQGKDFSLQQSQAGQQNAQYQNALNAAQLQLSQQQAQGGLYNQAQDRQLQAQQAALQAAQQQAQQTAQQAELNRRYALDESKYTTDADRAQTELRLKYGTDGQNPKPLKYEQQDRRTQWLAQVDQYTKNPAVAKVVEATAGHPTEGAANRGDLYSFIAAAVNTAKNQGIPDSEMESVKAAASAYYNTVIGKT